MLKVVTDEAPTAESSLSDLYRNSLVPMRRLEARLYQLADEDRRNGTRLVRLALPGLIAATADVIERQLNHCKNEAD